VSEIGYDAATGGFDGATTAALDGAFRGESLGEIVSAAGRGAQVEATYEAARTAGKIGVWGYAVSYQDYLETLPRDQQTQVSSAFAAEGIDPMGRYASVVRTGPSIWGYVATGFDKWKGGEPTIWGTNIRLPVYSGDNGPQVFEEFFHKKQMMRDVWSRFQVRSFMQFVKYGPTDVNQQPGTYEFEENCVSGGYGIINFDGVCN